MDSACVNEKGVAITGTVTGRTNEKAQKADPFAKDSGTVQAFAIMGDVMEPRNFAFMWTSRATSVMSVIRRVIAW